ncbi:MAG TPA: serine/threonine-protein kinase [Bryobacteraceae bacterium]|nr:serine/threonine-protein kinase [Bryobacteraceae bacterium]
MSVEWHRIEEVFQAASELPPVERQRFLAESCGEDRDLLNEVQSLLACESQAADFFEKAIGEVATSITDESANDRRIGPYRILRKLGQGGMGAVYLAERNDDQYHKHVALKLVRQGMDTPWLLERFRYERQILASLEHPHIARLLDGGTTEDGLPYIVMEYVEGRPLTGYAAAQNLDIPARLRLFRQVCGAVEYAHRKLVIHRDLKPANILVAEDGTPRLLDFGTAKLVSPEFADSGQTQTGAQMLTPDYASPEQLRGEPVTTASDVYSLGIILYELLAGRRPFDTAGRASIALERALTGTEAQAPSRAAAPEPKLRRTLAGDLDNIVLMAVRKEPERRYSSVEQFSEDIRRHLDGLPVRARADTVSYRVGKFLRRNRLAVGAVAAAVVALFGGIAIALWQAHEARLSAERAQRRFADVRALANTFLFDVQDKLRTVPGTLAVRKTLVDTALLHLDKLSREADDDPALQYELASAYDRVGRILGNPAEANLGNLAQARQNCAKAVALFDKALRAQPNNEEWLLGASAGYRRYAEALNPSSSRDALVAIARAVSLAQRAYDIGSRPDRFDNLRAALSRQGDYLRVVGDNHGAVKTSVHALEICKRFAKEQPGTASRRALAFGYCAHGVNLRHVGDQDGAAQNYRKCIEFREALVADEATGGLDRRNLGLSYLEVAKLEFYLHPYDLKYAANEASKALSTLQSISKDAGDKRALTDEASAHMVLGTALRSYDSAGARKHFIQALRIREGSAVSPLEISNLASTHSALGQLALTSGDRTLAREHLEKGVAAIERALAAEPGRISALATKVAIQLRLLDLHSMGGQWRDAERWAKSSIETATVLTTLSGDPSERTWLADALIAAGRLRQKQGDSAGAADHYKRSLAVWTSEKPPTSTQERMRRDDAASLMAGLTKR